MPRTAGGKNRASQLLPPLERYNRLSAYDQLICYYYWLYIFTGGIEGWDIKRGGWKEHWSHYDHIKAKYSSSAFYSLGKLMVQLATKISELGHHLEIPTIAGVVTQAPKNNTTSKKENNGDYQSEDEFEEEIMPAKPSQKLETKGVSDKLSTGDHNLPYPLLWGKYQSFSLTTRKRYTHIVFRILVHSFMTEHDIIFEWVNPRKLKIKVAWPDWWVCPEQQAEFDVDECGRPVYGHDHQLIGDIMDNNEARKGDDDRVWDDGYVVFDRDMSQDPSDTDVMLKPLEVASLNRTGQFIQVKTKVDPYDEKKKSPIKTSKSGRVAKPGTGGSGKTSHLTRKNNQDDHNTDSPRGNKRVARGRSKGSRTTRTRSQSRTRSQPTNSTVVVSTTDDISQADMVETEYYFE